MLALFSRFVPRQWIRWAVGLLGLGERYDVITLDLKPEYLQEAYQLPNDKIVIDSTFAFDDAKQAYERLVRPPVLNVLILRLSGIFTIISEMRINTH